MPYAPSHESPKGAQELTYCDVDPADSVDHDKHTEAITFVVFVSLALTLADDEHPEHEFGIDRRSAGLTVEWLQLLAKVSQHARHNRIDRRRRWRAGRRSSRLNK